MSRKTNRFGRLFCPDRLPPPAERVKKCGVRANIRKDAYICSSKRFPSERMFGVWFAIISLANVKSVIAILYVLIVAATVIVIVNDRRDPVKAMSWILVVTLLPVAGLIFYVVFGRNYRKEKIFNRKEIDDFKQIDRLCRVQLRDLVDPDIQHIESVEARKDIITLLLNNNRALLTVRNEVQILSGGREKFDALFEAIRGARSSIHLEYYIIEQDEIGRQLIALLEQKAAEGVEVRLIYDDVGSWGLKRRDVRRLRSHGIQVCCFMPVAFPWLTSKLNNRNHRKIVVIDGRIGFTGGINVADRYIQGTSFGRWRDLHLRIEGDAVNMLQAIFMTDWYFVSGKEMLSDEKYFPKSRVTSRSPMQIASSGPDSDWASIMQAFFAAISRARRSIYISTPYFLPNQSILTALKVAALSGVDVRIILPSRSDSKIVYWATRSYIGEMLDAGIKVYFYCKGFNHTKLIIVDDNFCSVGSANMDIRSFEDNFEVSAIMYDPRITAELRRSFLTDIEDSERITRGRWLDRPTLHAVYESVARLASPLL